MHIVTSTPHPSAAGTLRELGRREAAQERERQFAELALAFLATACPFPAVVYWLPERELYVVRLGGLELVRVDYDELRRTGNALAGATMLGLRARDAYLTLPTIEHDHQLGQD